MYSGWSIITEISQSEFAKNLFGNDFWWLLAPVTIYLENRETTLLEILQYF